MDNSRIFQVEKNNDDIRKIVLTNAVKMLTERNLLDHNKLDSNINNILDIDSDDHIYPIKVKEKEKERTYIVKILNQKITAISKQSVISDFLHKYKNSSKIIIVKDISTKARQIALNNYPQTEIFLEHELMINIMDYGLVPKHEVIDPDSDEAKTFFETYNVKKRNMPRILITDPVARYYNMKKGDVCRIVRPSDTSGFAPFYRLVI
jgi:DNA-directed RNA polymerase I, II, and III subunit RPABC1